MAEDFVLTLTPEIQVQVMSYMSQFYKTLKYTHDSLRMTLNIFHTEMHYYTQGHTKLLREKKIQTYMTPCEKVIVL